MPLDRHGMGGVTLGGDESPDICEAVPAIWHGTTSHQGSDAHA